MISLYDLLEAASGQLFGEPNAQLFTGFCLDSRLAEPNQMYVARKTDHGDTHQYIREAVEKGATGVVCSQPPDIDTDDLSVVIVRDSEAALMAWSRYVLGKLGTKVIGVTGSSGKSGTVEAIAHVLSSRYTVHKSSGVYGGRLRLPLALARLRAEHDMVVLEMAATQPGEVAEMVQATAPDVGVVTDVNYTHTDSFETVEQIAEDMGVLVEYLSPSGLAVLNYDDDLVRRMAARSRAAVKTIGTSTFGADLMAYNIVAGLTKTGFDLRYGTERYVGRWTTLLGRHQLYQVLAALMVGLHYDVPLENGLQAVTDMEPMPGRMQPLPGRNGSLIIDDTYNATPQSALAALDWLGALDIPRKIFVLGDMENLGSFSLMGHRQVGQRAAAVADVVVTEGPEAALAGRAVLDQGKDKRYVATTYSTQDTIAFFEERFQPTDEDIILVKGGVSARMENVVRALMEDPDDTQRLVRQGEEWSAVSLTQPTTPSWVEVDRAALANNVRRIRQMIGSDVTLMAVVKADAYGHGAVAASITALANGAEALAVSSLQEALELRDAGIDAPVLVLSYTPVYGVRQAIRQDVTLTLYDLDMAHAYNRAAREVGGKLRVHIKIDTGMGRLGVLADASIPFFRHLLNMQHLDIEGIYTHFSMADEDPAYTAEQLRVFKSVVNPLRASGFRFKYIHAANSAAVLTARDTYFDMVRVGVLLYGLSPSDVVPAPPEFEPALSWKTSIIQVKTLPPGHPVSYGQTYFTRSHERIAVIPVGYSNGFRRAPKNWGQVLVHGQYAPIIGRVSMEKTVISVHHIPDVAIGDEVVLLGRQGDAAITADDIARRLGTNNYEVVCTLLPRVPRR